MKNQKFTIEDFFTLYSGLTSNGQNAAMATMIGMVKNFKVLKDFFNTELTSAQKLLFLDDIRRRRCDDFINTEFKKQFEDTIKCKIVPLSRQI